MTQPPQWAAIGGSPPTPPGRPAGEGADIVINLCASATPVALARPKSPEFKAFSFFVSRRLEDGRERFRLHMGYFTSREQAERMLPAVRQLYPAAWIGEAPGRRLRAVPAGPGASASVILPAVPAAPAAPAAAAAPPKAVAPLPSVPDPQPEPLLPREAVDIDVLSPQDTQSWRDIREQIRLEAPVQYAVQLVWAVSPIDLASIASLSIFDAYSLYRIEGNRDGRRWYGLRLGFFSDADAAKQVAAYVRPEFEQVAVVPVSVREREQASAVVAAPARVPERAAPVRQAPAPADEFRLFEDSAASPKRPAEATRAPARTRPRARVAEVDHDSPGGTRGLDQTLEILGAGDLSFEGAKAPRNTRNDRPAPEDWRRSRFGRLLDRVSKRLLG
jgi:hypothetical protein